ncbi:MAG: hypothetical protein K6A40_05640 [Solobacterium sp.]|nr:hypothetical protein [Solobacterium sp.]
MRIRVRLIQRDLITGTEKILADTDGLLINDTLSYFEESGARHRVTFGTDEIRLERISDITSCTVLGKKGIGRSVVESPYGRMEMPAVLKAHEKTENAWMAEYQVLAGQEPVTDQRLVWIISPSSKFDVD